MCCKVWHFDLPLVLESFANEVQNLFFLPVKSRLYLIELDAYAGVTSFAKSSTFVLPYFVCSLESLVFGAELLYSSVWYDFALLRMSKGSWRPNWVRCWWTWPLWIWSNSFISYKGLAKGNNALHHSTLRSRWSLWRILFENAFGSSIWLLVHFFVEFIAVDIFWELYD